MFRRALHLPEAGTETFFLWGPRQVGKSTLLRQTYPNATWVNLLKSEEYRRYLDHPELLREEVKEGAFVVVDEVQKIPALLDEVHYLHETRGARFALSGSSARKVRRGQANLLGGRAIRYELAGLVSHEIGEGFDLTKILNGGYLPPMVLANKPLRLLRSYVGDYLKEEVAAEGLVRRLPVFSQFLNIAALSDSEVVNLSTIGREVGVSHHTVRSYFQILEDTLLAHWLPAFRKNPKRRIQRSPKLYFADVGTANFLAKRHELQPGSMSYGKAFENWVHHELRSFNLYQERFAELAYWRLSSGIEVDFVVGQGELAIEAKATPRIRSHHLNSLREFKKEHPSVASMIVVCLEDKERKSEDGIRILPYKAFCQKLWAGHLF